MGGLMLANSASFIEDIPMEEEHGHNKTDSRAFFDAMEKGYKASATNCFGATAMYAGCLVFCLIQVFFNVKVANMNAELE